MTRHIGGSLLPSAGWGVYGVKPGLHGSFETRPLEEHDTHGLGGVGVERAVIEDMVEGNFDETVAIDLSDDTAPAP